MCGCGGLRGVVVGGVSGLGERRRLAGLAEQGGVIGALPSLRVQQLVPVNEREAVTSMLAGLERAAVEHVAVHRSRSRRRLGAVGWLARGRSSCGRSSTSLERRAPRPSLDVSSARPSTPWCCATYSIGHWADGDEPPQNPVLVPLAERMEAVPALKVRLFLNVARRKALEGAPSTEVVQDFRRRFLTYVWPAGARLPAIYYDPRSLERSDAVLHAKCIVVDDAKALITSANLAEAAQENIEAGVLLEDPVFAKALRQQFDSLIDAGLVRLLPDLRGST